MKRSTYRFVVGLLLFTSTLRAADPLRGWNDTAPKQAIVAFVAKVTKEGSPEFVKPEDRVAVFDNDGTLWCEHPVYFQVAFALDRIKALAPQHPQWKDQEPYKFVLNGDMKGLMAEGNKGLLTTLAATHSGMTTDEYNATVKEWLKTARHPRFKQPYDKCVYQPMLELLAYLRANGFKTFIVSGGGIEFMRNFAEKVYGIPPEQVVGSSGVVKFELRDGLPVLIKEPKVEFIDDGPGKPVGINRFIGRRPVMAFGNSDGDLQMLQWTTIDRKLTFGLIVHHTDAVREYAYDQDTHIGRLAKALDEAPQRGWTVVDMKKDWRVVFAFDK
jgi:phosphoglycolate phosphatase-like HAD superfamily hydrolase